MIGACLEASLLKRIVERLKDNGDQTVWVFSEDGLRFLTMDESRVNLGTLCLDGDSFRYYNYQTSGPNLALGLDLTKISDMLELESNEPNSVVAIIAKENGNEIDFFFNWSNENSDFKVHFNLVYTPTPLGNLDVSKYEVPKTDYVFQIRMRSSELIRICQNLSSFGDTILISGNKENVQFSSSGPYGERTMNYRSNPELSIRTEMQESISSSFSNRQLNLFLDILLLNISNIHYTNSEGFDIPNPFVNLSFSPETLLCVNSDDSVSFYLPPQLENEKVFSALEER